MRPTEIRKNIEPVGEFVERVVNKVPDADTVIVAARDRAGTWFTFYQHARPSDLAMASVLLSHEALEIATEDL